jgi:hypothetical protein
MAIKIEHTGSFKAQSTDGQKYTIFIFTEYVIGEMLNDPTGTFNNGFHLKTSEGKHVNHIGKGKYVILGLHGEIPITSDDPNAP